MKPTDLEVIMALESIFASLDNNLPGGRVGASRDGEGVHLQPRDTEVSEGGASASTHAASHRGGADPSARKVVVEGSEKTFKSHDDLQVSGLHALA